MPEARLKTGSGTPDLESIYGPGGAIASRMEGYEFRPQQPEMAGAVLDAFNSRQHLVVEAGTGVGKSFAYLIPAVHIALSTGQVVVISTNTIGLQEQIAGKDVPFVKSIWPEEFQATLVKGRSNYVCLRRLERAWNRHRELFETTEEQKDLGRLFRWASKTRDGSRADLDRRPYPRLWEKVCADRDTCLGRKCPLFDRCFFQNARAMMNSSQLIIVNHHLYFSDFILRLRGHAILPEHDCVVFDEAHNIEAVAGKHLGIEVSNFGVRHYLDGLFRPEKERGLLAELDEPRACGQVERCRQSAEEFFGDVDRWLKEGESDTRRVGRREQFPGELKDELAALASELSDVRSRAREQEDELEITAMISRGREMLESLESFLELGMPDSVYWVERSGRGGERMALRACAVSVAGELGTNLFGRIGSAVLTSATLTTAGTFSYFRERVGLGVCQELLLGSPFDFQRQVTLYIARGMPDPNDRDDYRDKVIEKVKHYLEMSRGRAFVLFTSYRLMKEVANALTPLLERRGITVFRQGEGMAPGRLLEEFRKDVDSVLFGTDTFWAGVDVQGEALTNVIITRLPFSVPDHPVTEARMEALRAAGRDAFLEYSVPEAIIKLRQGFGRLIRTREDHGMVVILDSRILRRSYGQQFLASLPGCEIVVE